METESQEQMSVPELPSPLAQQRRRASRGVSGEEGKPAARGGSIFVGKPEAWQGKAWLCPVDGTCSGATVLELGPGLLT